MDTITTRTVSDTINNSLSAISGAISLLETTSLTAEQKEYLTYATQGAASLLSLSRSMTSTPDHQLRAA